VEFLQWALPPLGMRWEGFRKVRRQVCRRLRRRLGELGLPDVAAYRAHLERDPDEWPMLDGLLHITISRFHRDRGVFAALERAVIPALAAGALARGADALEVWSAGCASGEEPYTLALMWQLELAERFPALTIRILATDVDDAMLARARRGCFAASSLDELPERWRSAAFAPHGELFRLRDPFREPVTFARHDVRTAPPYGAFDLVLCRNLAFTYFDRELQSAIAARLVGALRTGGALVLGAHEALPDGLGELEPWSPGGPIHRRTGLGGPEGASARPTDREHDRRLRPGRT
jgi:chemotaxis protein methyltransferase CheR